MGRRLALVTALLLLPLLAPVSCAREDRPDPAAWGARWQAARRRIPPPEAFGDRDARELCDELLVAVRELRSTLLPTPDASLDDAVREWIELAGTVGYDCSPAHGDLEGYRSATGELHSLEVEIEAALALLESGGDGGP